MGEENCRASKMQKEVSEMELTNNVVAVMHIAAVIGESPHLMIVICRVQCVPTKEQVSKINVMAVEEAKSDSGSLSTRMEETTESAQAQTF